MRKIANDINEYLYYTNKFSIEHKLPNTGLSPNEPLNQAYYRGQSNIDWKLEPSINRNGNIIFEEKIMQFVYETKNLSAFQTLSYLQHYKTGTRLLDFTKHPLIALYFACNKHYDKDGVVYAISYQPRRSEWNYTKIPIYISCLQNEKEEVTIEEYAKFLLKVDLNYSLRLQNFDEFCAEIMSILPYGTMIEPNEEDYKKNERLKNQFGTFFICPPIFKKMVDCNTMVARKSVFYRNKVKCPEKLVADEYSETIVIPKERKEAFLINLKNDFNIDENRLFI